MFTRQLLTVIMIALASGLPVYADSGKGPFNHGQSAERQGNLDAAVGYYKQAYTVAPSNAKYLAAYTRMRFIAAAQHVHTGTLLRNAGSAKEALVEFQRAVDLDSSSFIAQQELRRTTDMISRQERQRVTPRPTLPPASKLSEDFGQPVELQPSSNSPISMYMTVNTDVAYRTIGKLAGFNVLMDPDYKPQKITVDLTNVTLRDALEMVRLESKTFWRPVLSNAIFVAADSPTKRKELEQNVIRTFYLRNIETPNELQEAANVVRQMLDLTRVQLVQAHDALILRGTPDQMLLAEKLLTDFDKPRSEVIIDITVMQVSRDRLRNLGATLPTSFSVSTVQTNGTSNSSGSGTSTSGSAGAFALNTLSKLGSGNFVVSIPGGSFTLLASESNSKILQNPEIRALNNEKATLRIGDRVPIATGSFQPGLAGGGGVSPLISTQFQYLDVGVNIDITPHIHSNNDVTLKMSLEISSVTGQQNIGGITQPVIGQRRIEHETRLSDGEVNLLGGILEDTETRSLSGYPWISKIPVLKYLFAQENKDRQENEIVFAITPHIIRAQEVTDENLRTMEVGTSNLIELRRNTSTPNPPSPKPADDSSKSPASVPQNPGKVPESGTIEPSKSPAQAKVQ